MMEKSNILHLISYQRNIYQPYTGDSTYKGDSCEDTLNTLYRCGEQKSYSTNLPDNISPDR